MSQTHSFSKLARETTHSFRRVVAIGAISLTVGALCFAALPAWGSATASVAEAVTTALKDAGGASVTVDKSCGTVPPAAGPSVRTAARALALTVSVGRQPVAFGTNRVVVRTPVDAIGTVDDRVRAALSAIDHPDPVEVRPEAPILFPDAPDGPIDPVIPVSLDTGAGPPVDVVALARELNRPGEGTSASPDYVMSPSSGSSGMWPNGYPRWTDTLPTPRAAAIGTGTVVAVYDTGLPPQSHSTWPPNVSRLTNGDVEALDQRAPYGEVDLYYGGHTLAIASVIATLAPAAEVRAVRITRPDGIATDTVAARRMAVTLSSTGSGGGPDVIVNSFGSPVCVTGSGEDLVPLGLEAVSEAVWRYRHAVLVAASGNRSSNQRIYPAAFETVVSVGALDNGSVGDPWTSTSRSGPPAWFSDFGDWVTVWAPGTALAVNHVDGLRFEPGGDTITGVAIVDGTSVATPYFAALVADQMAATGQSPRLAARAVIDSGTRCSATVGSGVAVALTSMAASATTRAPSGLPSAC